MAGRRKGSGIVNRKTQVSQFEKGIELLGSLGLEILERLGTGNPASVVALSVKPKGCAKSTVTYWKNKLITVGALRLKTPGIVKYYELTPFGSKLLAGSEGGLTEPVVLEDHAFKYRVLQEETHPVDWRKLGSPRNWVQLGVRIGDAQVEKTSQHVIIHPGRLSGFDPKELEYDAVRIVERIRIILEGKFGMVLGDDGVRLHEPIFRFYSEEAKEDVKHCTTIVEGVGSIDSSPPERVPHEEYQGEERARARLLLPDSVKTLMGKVEGVGQAVESLALEQGHLIKSVESLTDSLNKFIALLKGSGDPVSAQSADEEEIHEYIR